jgi:hypothetical protein
MKPEAQMYDARGNRISGDVLRESGGRVKVPMMLMDAEMQDVAETTRKAFADADDASDGIMHKPGYVKTGISDAIAKTQQVLRDDRLDKQQEAWRNPPPLEIKMDADPAHSPDIKAPQSLAVNAPGQEIDIEAFHERRLQRLQNSWKAGA